MVLYPKGMMDKEVQTMRVPKGSSLILQCLAMLCGIAVVVPAAVPQSIPENAANMPSLGAPASDVTVHLADGTTVRLPSLLQGHYTVLVGGCLTCPVFLRTYPDVEAVHRDYKDKGVVFYYLYNALAHPENNGFVNPFTLEEKLKHVAIAREKLGTGPDWLCDPLTNEAKYALGDLPNPEFIFDPQGEVVYSQVWSNAEALRAKLAELVGPVDPPTQTADLHLPNVTPRSDPAQGLVPRLQVSETLRPLVMTPEKSVAPFYAKLRAEASQGLLDSGSGKLYLGFHMDPIYEGIHWNNLAGPFQYKLALPQGVTAHPAEGAGPKLEAMTDNDPREFLVEVEGWREGAIEVTVNYYACSDTEGWCKNIIQSYRVQPERQREMGGVFGRSFGAAQAGRVDRGRQAPPGPAAGADGMFQRTDRNADGRIDREEAPPGLVRQWDRFDADKDGVVSASEFERAIPNR